MSAEQHTSNTSLATLHKPLHLIADVAHSTCVRQKSTSWNALHSSFDMSAHPSTELPSLPDTAEDASENDFSSFADTLVRLGDAAGSTPAVRQQLVADGVLARITQLLQQRSEWATQATSDDSSRSIEVLAQCLRVCGNSCIDCDAARDSLLQHAALPAILACLRRTSRVDVLKFAAGALANLVCAHEAAQEAFLQHNSTAVVVPALNKTMSVTTHPSSPQESSVRVRDSPSLLARCCLLRCVV